MPAKHAAPELSGDLGTPPAVAAGGWREAVSLPGVSLRKRLTDYRSADWPFRTVIGLFVLFLGLIGHVAGSLWIVFVLPLLIGLVLDINRSRTCYRKVIQEIEAMSDRPAMPDQFPVRMRLWHEGVLYGEDVGTVSILEGGVHFSGQQTEFSLSRRIAELGTDRWSQALFLKPSGGMAIDFRVRDFDGRVVLIPLGGPGVEGSVSAGKLYGNLHLWDRSPPSSGWGRVIGPPTRPQPGRLRSRNRNDSLAMLGLFGAWVAFVFVLAACVSLRDLSVLATPSALMAVAALAATWFVGRRERRAWRVLRSMERRGGNVGD